MENAHFKIQTYATYKRNENLKFCTTNQVELLKSMLDIPYKLWFFKNKYIIKLFTRFQLLHKEYSWKFSG